MKIKIILVVAILLTSCQSTMTPTPDILEVTRIVEQTSLVTQMVEQTVEVPIIVKETMVITETQNNNSKSSSTIGDFTMDPEYYQPNRHLNTSRGEMPGHRTHRHASLRGEGSHEMYHPMQGRFAGRQNLRHLHSMHVSKQEFYANDWTQAGRPMHRMMVSDPGALMNERMHLKRRIMRLKRKLHFINKQLYRQAVA